MPSHDSEQSSADTPCDFLVHLSQRLEVSFDAALDRLGSWLLTYEPKGRRPIRIAGACELLELALEDSGERRRVA